MSKKNLGRSFTEAVSWVLQMRKGTAAFNALVEEDIDEMFMVLDYILS